MKASSDLHRFLWNSSNVFKNVANELALVFLVVKYNISYRCMDCASKLLNDIFHDSNMFKKMPCGRTKTEAIVKNFLAPRRSARLDRCVEESSKIKQLFPYWN
jgi:hypothetical protein